MGKAELALNNSLTKLDGFTSIEDMKEWAKYAIDSGLLPNAVTEPEQVVVIVQHGKELGLTPFIAIQNINIISGKPVLSSTMLGALMKRRDIEWIWEEDFIIIKNDKGETEIAPDNNPNRRTTVHVYWKSKVTDRVMDAKFSVTWAQFVIAGLTKKDNYIKLPKEMVRARCLSSMCRAYFPEVLSGFYTDLEMQDNNPEENVSINVNDEGDIILTKGNK
jgi:hypothetical protein